MSLDNESTRALHPAVVALGATVECFPRYPGVIMDDYYMAIKAAIDAGETTFVYGGTEITFELDEEHKLKRLSVTIALGEPLPAVFSNNLLLLNFVVVTCSVPEVLLARPGWYVGLNYGFLAGACQVDPIGEVNDGKPTIYANGGATDEDDENDNLSNQLLFDAVTNLFIGVMSGEIVHNGDDSGRIIRA